ncbi:hypothetical protein DRJ25_03470 [Candidatus Woesearchaeota archaeon]|nr:MAG: hypothetical protein DRJ25_03470 [Candidatus Woesearchaeota archaeon]
MALLDFFQHKFIQFKTTFCPFFLLKRNSANNSKIFLSEENYYNNQFARKQRASCLTKEFSAVTFHSIKDA